MAFLTLSLPGGSELRGPHKGAALETAPPQPPTVVPPHPFQGVKREALPWGRLLGSWKQLGDPSLGPLVLHSTPEGTAQLRAVIVTIKRRRLPPSCDCYVPGTVVMPSRGSLPLGLRTA